MTEYDDVEVERRVRASLDNHAGEVDTSVPVAARARAAARRHRGRRIAAGAAVAVAAVAVAAVVVDRADPPSSEPPPAASPSPSQAAMPDGWRTEYWHDVSVQVPADWGWGTAPMNPARVRGERVAFLCGGPGAIRNAQGTDLTNPDATAPYVGRPIMLSDACVGGMLTHPAAPYVWFDAQVEPGTVRLARGYVQDTVEIGRDGTTVTVGSDDQALRARILASVARQDLCATAVDAAGLELGNEAIDGRGELQSAHLCAYTRRDDDRYELVYGRDLDTGTFGRFDRALDRAPEDDRLCKAPGDLMVVAATSDDDVSQTWVADLACDTVASSDGMRSLTLDVLESLAGMGVRSTLREFIGMQG